MPPLSLAKATEPARDDIRNALQLVQLAPLNPQVWPDVRRLLTTALNKLER